MGTKTYCQKLFNGKEEAGKPNSPDLGSTNAIGIWTKFAVIMVADFKTDVENLAESHVCILNNTTIFASIPAINGVSILRARRTMAVARPPFEIKVSESHFPLGKVALLDETAHDSNDAMVARIFLYPVEQGLDLFLRPLDELDKRAVAIQE